MSVREKCRSTARLLLLAAVVLAACGAIEARAAAGPPAADLLAVPNGSPAELAIFITRLLTQEMPTPEAEEMAKTAALEAADKILAGRLHEDAVKVAVAAKVLLLKDEEDLQELAARLTRAKMPDLARRARGAALLLRVADAAGQSSSQLEDALKLASQHLLEGQILPTDVELAVDIARIAEEADRAGLAAELLRSFTKRCLASRDTQLAGLATTMQPVLRRVSLPGNPISIEGVLLNGARFDWPKYRGKVVLLEFWATWCGACVAETPNLKEVYDEYHGRGLEIVAISLDDNRQDLVAFVLERQIPWTIVHNEGGNPTASYYGISSIPTMILIGRDGNVLSLNVRGSRLSAILGGLLGEADMMANADLPPAETQPKRQTEPPARAQPKQEQPLKDPVVIRITAQGVASIGGEPFDGRDFRGLMAAKVPEADRPATPIQIEASADVKYENAVRGINALKALGFRVFKYVQKQQ